VKKLIIINGTMGVGKTAVCEVLYRRLHRCVWLDGDWCWMMHPWTVTEENKQMVEDNITHLLRNFLTNPSFQYVLFSWVIHRSTIFDLILTPLADIEFLLYRISLVCSPQELTQRLLAQGRTQESVAESLRRLDLYEEMDTIKVDSSHLDASRTAAKVLEIIENTEGEYHPSI